MSETEEPSKASTSPAKPARPLATLAVALVAVAAVMAVYLLRDNSAKGVVEERTGVDRAPARPVERESSPAAVGGAAARPAAAREAPSRSPETQRTEPQVGDVFEGLVVGEGSRGDGRLRVRGRTVYVAGARRNETIRFRLTQERGQVFLGDRVPDDTPLTVLAPRATAPLVEVSADATVLNAAESEAQAVQPGAVFRLVLEDRDRFNPDRNAFCRIGGFAVVVENAQPGPDEVTIQIKERLERRAVAELVEVPQP